MEKALENMEVVQPADFDSCFFLFRSKPRPSIKTNFFNALQVGLTEFVGIHLKKNTDCSQSQYSLTHRLKAIAVTREECEKLQFDAQASCFKERLWRERSMHAIVDLSSQYLLGRCHGTQRFNSIISHVLYEV